MSWLEAVEGSAVAAVSSERARALDEARADKLPAIEKETTTGMKPVEPISFQPVRSPGIYQLEFAPKGEDILFHIWPDGYHKAVRAEQRLPKFPKNFRPALESVLSEVFGAKRFTVEEDADVGAVFVKCTGWGTHQFARDLAIQACQKLHAALGGVEG